MFEVVLDLVKGEQVYYVEDEQGSRYGAFSEEDKAQEFDDALNADVVMIKKGLPSLQSLAPIHVNALTENAERWARENGVTGLYTGMVL